MTTRQALIESAEQQARERADRDRRTMYVYLSTEQRPHDKAPALYAYVRNSDEGAPAGSTMHATIHPQEVK